MPSPCQDFYKLPAIDFQLDECEMMLEKEEPIYKKYAGCKTFLKRFTNFLCFAFPSLKKNFEYLVSQFYLNQPLTLNLAT